MSGMDSDRKTQNSIGFTVERNGFLFISSFRLVWFFDISYYARF